MSYLSDRKQIVRLGEYTSEWMTLMKGVPQGSTLGPCLYSLFINDPMFAVKHIDPVKYADANIICARANSLPEAIQKLGADCNISIDCFTHAMQALGSIYGHWYFCNWKGCYNQIGRL